MVVAAQENNSHTNSPYVADARVRIGHVHLKVADLERALRFYAGVLGMEVMQRYGDGAVFLSAGGGHLSLCFYYRGGGGGGAALSPPPAGHGRGLLFIPVYVYPTRSALATALRRVLEAKIPLQGAADHG